MIRKEGIHLYIQITNLDSIVKKEENGNKSLEHSIHALNASFTLIERESKSKGFIVEKVTGSRLHLYCEECSNLTFENVMYIVRYVKTLFTYFNNKVAKYKTLPSFEIKMGAACGDFYEFIFDKTTEITTIGYAANFAAKLQASSKIGCLSISEELYNRINYSYKKGFDKELTREFLIYKQNCYYICKVKPLEFVEFEKKMKEIDECINKINLCEIDFLGARELINPETLSVKQSKCVEGCVLFADVRGFTKKFDSQGNNLKLMKNITKNVLEAMYNKVVNKGVHLQFQGDREVALFHKYAGNDIFVKDSVLTAMSIIDSIRNISKEAGINFTIGIGIGFGNVFISRIGTNNEKDVVILGKTVNEANYLEDNCALENEIAISKNAYLKLQEEEKKLCSVFEKRNDYYVTKVSKSEYINKLQAKKVDFDTRNRNYNGAWLDFTAMDLQEYD